MEYKKKSLSNLDIKKDYEEIDTRLASGWYVDDINTPKKKIYKTKKTTFKISKKFKIFKMCLSKSSNKSSYFEVT